MLTEVEIAALLWSGLGIFVIWLIYRDWRRKYGGGGGGGYPPDCDDPDE